MRIVALLATAILGFTATACGSYPTECGRDLCGKISANCSSGKTPVLNLQVGINNKDRDKDLPFLDYTYVVKNEEGAEVARETRRITGRRLDEVEVPFTAAKVSVSLSPGTSNPKPFRVTNTCSPW